MTNWVGPLVNMVPFSKNGLQVLAGMYLGGLLLSWDQLGLFDVLFGSGMEPEMFVLKWDMSSLLSEIIFVVNPGTPDACILRLNMAPEYLWLGLHWAGTPQTVPITTYLTHLAALLKDRPLLAGAVLHRTRPVDEEWQTTMAVLLQHFDLASAISPSSSATVDMAMEGVEATPPGHVDSMIRDIGPDMNLLEDPVPGFAPPSAPVMSPSSAAKALLDLRDAPRSPSPDYEAPRRKYRARY